MLRKLKLTENYSRSTKKKLLQILKRAKSAVAADLEKGRDVRPSQIALEVMTQSPLPLIHSPVFLITTSTFTISPLENWDSLCEICNPIISRALSSLFSSVHFLKHRTSSSDLQAKKLAKEVLEGFTALSVPAQTDLKSSFSDLFLLVEQSEITMSDLQ